MFLPQLGLPYTGPLEGHDVVGLVNTLKEQKKRNAPRVLHIRTIKGKGYPEAEAQQTKWHSVKYVKIDAANGDKAEVKPPKFQEVFGHTLVELAKANERVVGITPAMPTGSSMDMLMKAMPDRVFDVGIAEQHAVTFAAGLAAEGMRPFCHLYASFAQRANDQIIHDVALQNLPVIFCLDRAGLVGEDGPTHHGVFDISQLRTIPNLTIVSPMDLTELRDAMHWAVTYTKGPVVIRYPRGRGQAPAPSGPPNMWSEKEGRFLSRGKEVAIISIGTIGAEVSKAIHASDLKNGVTHLDLRFVKPLSSPQLKEILEDHTHIITVEEGMISGGCGEGIQAWAMSNGYKGEIITLGLPDEFAPHGSVAELRKHYGLDASGIAELLDQFKS